MKKMNKSFLTSYILPAIQQCTNPHPMKMISTKLVNIEFKEERSGIGHKTQCNVLRALIQHLINAPKLGSKCNAFSNASL
jgi:hypothetical protein